MNCKIIVIICLVVLANLSFTQSFDLKASIQRGEKIYKGNCMSCHLAEGQGVQGVFPPLQDSDHLSDKERLVSIMENGMNKTIERNGVTYSTPMQATNLSEEEIADVLNYIRNSWGNNGDAISPAQVKNIIDNSLSK